MSYPGGVTRVALAFAFGLAVGIARADDGTQPAFAISKETNDNVVKYDVRLRPDCTIDPDDPLDIYWITRDRTGRPKREGLNFIEKTLYGFAVDKSNPHVLTGEVKALKSKGEHLGIRVQVEPRVAPAASTLVRAGQGGGSRQQAGSSGEQARAAAGRGCAVKAFIGGPKLPQEMQIKALRLKQFDGSQPRAVGIEGTSARTKLPQNYTVQFTKR